MRVQRKRRKNVKKNIAIISILSLVLFISIMALKKVLIDNFDHDKKSLSYASSIDDKKTDSYAESKLNITKDDLKKMVDENEGNEEAPPDKTKDNNDKPKDTKVAANSEKKDYKSIFNGDVFVGDSISDGLAYYDFINSSNVIAKLGCNLLKADNEVDKIASLKPKNIYILFGANDMDAKLSSEMFTQRYEKLIKDIKAKSPNSKIYIQSILPVSDKAVKSKPHLNSARINEFNNALKKMAEKEDINYVNIASVLKNTNTDLHEGDGIHFKYQFYILWLNYLADNTK
jgi:lysophospholipase L1-like esterase